MIHPLGVRHKKRVLSENMFRNRQESLKLHTGELCVENPNKRRKCKEVKLKSRSLSKSPVLPSNHRKTRNYFNLMMVWRSNPADDGVWSLENFGPLRLLVRPSPPQTTLFNICPHRNQNRDSNAFRVYWVAAVTFSVIVNHRLETEKMSEFFVIEEIRQNMPGEDDWKVVERKCFPSIASSQLF